MRKKHESWLLYSLGMAIVVAGLMILSAWLAESTSDRKIGIIVESRQWGLTVTSVAPNLPADRAGLSEGDVILSVDGRKIAKEANYQSAAQTFQSGLAASFEIKREGRKQVLEVVPGVPAPWMKFSFNLLVALSYLVLGALTLKRRPGFLRASLLSLFCAAVAIELATTAFPPIGLPLLSLVLLQSYYLLTGLQFGLQLHLASVFPEQQPWLMKRAWVIACYYIFGITFAVLACFTQLANLGGVNFIPWSAEELDRVLNFIVFPVWSFSLVVLLGRSALFYSDPEGRKEARILLCGIMPWALYVLATSALQGLKISLPSWIGGVETFLLLPYPAAILFVLWREVSAQHEAGLTFYEELRLAGSTPRLLEIIAAKTKLLFHPKSLYVCSQGEGPGEYKLLRIGETESVEVAFDRFTEIIRIVERNGEIVEVETLIGALPRAEKELLDQLRVELLVPLSNSEHEIIGVMMISEKKSGSLYTPEDREIMQMIMWQALAASSYYVEASRGLGPTATSLGNVGGNVVLFPSQTSPALRTMQRIFVSYAHKENGVAGWLNSLTTHVSGLKDENIDLWYDKLIEPGTKWPKEIRKGLERARVAVLLIGPKFVISDFILKTELPLIRDAARKQGLKIYPLVVSRCQHESVLEEDQAFNSVDAPLDELTPGEQNRIIFDLVEAVEQFLHESDPSKAQAL